jgi:hypothetical protein
MTDKRSPIEPRLLRRGLPISTVREGPDGRTRTSASAITTKPWSFSFAPELDLSRSLGAGRVRFNKRHQAAHLGLAIRIALGKQTVG